MYLILDHNLWKKTLFIITPSNPSLAHQEVVSDVMYEPPTKKIRSLTEAIINAAYDVNLAAKMTITQEEGSVNYSKTHLEEALPEISQSSEKSSTKDMLHKRTATMMVSSKTRNYHICDIIYNLYRYNIFQNKK